MRNEIPSMPRIFLDAGLKEARAHPVKTIAGVLALAFLGYVGIVEAPKVNAARQHRAQVDSDLVIMADKNGNKDGATTDNEWAEVYKELGVPYNSHNVLPLTFEQKEKYLANHR